MMEKPNYNRLRFVVLAAIVPMLGGLACDSEDDPEIVTVDQAVVDEVPDDLIEAVLQVPDPGEGVAGDDARATGFTAEGKPLAFQFQGWFSEENAGSSQCPIDQVVTGFDCSGSYCDNVNIECNDYGTSVGTGGTFSAWFEREYSTGWDSPGTVKTMAVCASNQKMTGIDCAGSYCDDISIECTDAPGLGTNRCAWSNWYSEENPSPFFAPVGSAIQGAWCEGTHCDNKRFLVCEI